MYKSLPKVFSVLLILALMLPVFPAQSALAATPTDLFFSEYIEGSSNNKALEIYNGTGSAIDLAAGGYNVQMFFNGSSSAGLTIDLTGTVANGDVYVLAQSSAATAILDQADQINGAGWFNGDDAVVLRKGTTIIDVIGQIGFDPGSEWGSGDASTANNTLRRKADICTGDSDGSNAFDPSVEWNGFAQDTFDGLGTHTANCGGGGVTTGQSLPLVENFDDCTLAGWEIISVDSDTADTWSCSETYSNIEANGYGNSAPANEWLITPALNMDAQGNDTLTFRSYTNYTDINYPQLHVLYSTDYDGGGDPISATWTELTGINLSSEGSHSWADSGEIDLSGISGTNVYFAFQYESSGTGGGTAADWRLDAISFFEKVVTPAIPLPLSEAFNDCALAGWEIVSVDADTSHTWSCNSTYSNIEANGYGDSAPANEWLITPALNMDAQENDTLTFRNYTNYSDSNYPQLHVLYSTDYDGNGDPTSATWTELNGIAFSPENSGKWVDSGAIDLSGISGTNVYFAFQYVSSGTGGGTAADWRLDSINFFERVPIGEVQGSVGDTDDGFNFASPLAGQTVAVQGVIYENTLARTSSGGDSHTFFIQNTAATSDGDPNSSDGLFVYIGYYSTLRIKGGGYYTPTVGDEVVLQGPIQEYYGQTELSNPYVLSVVNHNVDIPAFEADPPADLADAYRYWERREGMRAEVPTDSVVLNGRNVFASTADAEVWVARPDSVIAQRSETYARRAFRDAHPLDDNYDANNWDGNGYRILMGSLGIKAAVGDNTTMINPARTFDTVDGSPTGGVYFDYGKYSIQVDQQVVFNDGVDPSLNNPPQAFDRTADYSIVDYNLENLYDYRDNPSSGCDFNGPENDKCSKTGTPFLSDITPSYDYVPASDAAYQARLNDIALQIVNDLHSPDILMVQEVENQDVCSVVAGTMDCGTNLNNPDGKPDVLQDLALRIAASDIGGPAYDAAFDSDSSDLRGILPAFMYRTDRVQLLPAAGDPVLGGSPAIAGYTAVPYDSDASNPKTLNADLPAGISACETSWVFPRAPSVGLFRIYRISINVGNYQDVYLINNHFKSGPDSCVAHRTEQAKYNAALVAFLQSEKPNARVVVGGDLNVYPRPDDPFAPIGQAGSSDQLGALYGQSLGLQNLWEVLLGKAPESAYSYVYVGMAQTLDQMFVNQPLLADLQQFRSVHINSDFPADYPGDVARGTSDHDPQIGTFSLPVVTIDELIGLVHLYADDGQITGNNTEKALLDHLNKAVRFKANGQEDAYRSQLQAFIDQVHDKTPQFVTPEAANALVSVANVLLTLP